MCKNLAQKTGNPHHFRSNPTLLSVAVAFACLTWHPAGAADIIANPNIINTEQAGDTAYGIKESGADANNGVVTVRNGGKIGFIYGGSTSNADADNNTVTVIGTASQKVYGGHSSDGDADDNTVNVNGGTIEDNTYGGFTEKGDTQENRLILSNNSRIGGSSIGGYTKQGDSEDNTVTVNSGTLSYLVAGGLTEAGDSEDNTVNISDGTISHIVIGGLSRYGNADSNTLNISGGTFTKQEPGVEIAGGGGVQKATNNTLTISGGNIRTNAISGGWSWSDLADANSLTVSGGNINVDTLVAGGTSLQSAVTNNTTTISGGTLSTLQDSVVGGLAKNGTASGNSLIVSGGNVAANELAGGGALSHSTGNRVTVSNGTVRANTVIGGWSINGNSSDNRVTVSGGNAIVTHFIAGGTSVDGNATDNSITISKGSGNNPTFLGTTVLYGGYDWKPATVNDVKSGNTLNLHTTDITVKNIANFEKLYFYVQDDTPADATFLTLKENADTNITGTTIGVGVEGSNTLLTKDDEIVLIHKDSLQGKLLTDATLNNTVTGMQGIAVLYDFTIEKKNDKTLIARLSGTSGTGGTTPGTGGTTPGTGGTTPGTGGTTPGTGGTTPGTGGTTPGTGGTTPGTGGTTPGTGGTTPGTGGTTPGTGETTPGTEETTPGTTSARVNPQTKSLSETRVAAVNIVNQGADLAADEGMSRLIQVAQSTTAQGFAAVGGGSSRTDTGSYIDVKGISLLTGIGKGFDNNSGKLSIGAFFEAGRGSYDSFNDFSDAADVRAEGDTHYYGVGIMARQQFNNQWFIDGGVRIGKSHMDYYSSDLVDAAGNPTAFSGKSTYSGVNIGVGRQFALSEKSSLTPYAKLLWTHYNGIERTIAGSTFDFGNVDSLRSQLGARFERKISEQSQLYADLSWIHEYQGTAKGNVLGFALPEPSLEGDSGMIGAGFNLKPSENLSIDVGINGEFGNRRGAGATGKFKFSF